MKLTVNNKEYDIAYEGIDDITTSKSTSFAGSCKNQYKIRVKFRSDKELAGYATDALKRVSQRNNNFLLEKIFRGNNGKNY